MPLHAEPSHAMQGHTGSTRVSEEAEGARKHGPESLLRFSQEGMGKTGSADGTS